MPRQTATRCPKCDGWKDGRSKTCGACRAPSVPSDAGTQAEFIEWLVDPSREGTQEAWAEAHSLHPRTLSAWKKAPAFREAWDRRLAELNVNPDRIQRVVDALYENATDRESRDQVKAANLYLQYVEKFTPKRQVVGDRRSLEDMSDEELEELIAAGAEAELHERRLRAVE